MTAIKLKANSRLNISIISDVLKNGKIKTGLREKNALYTLENDIEKIKDILFNNISSSEIIEIIEMDMKRKTQLQLEEKNKYVNNNGLNGSSSSNCGGGDNQSDPYVRKSDLTVALSIFVTKADLKEELKDFVRRSELKYELNQLETNLRKDMANFVTKDEFNEKFSSLEARLDKIEKRFDRLEEIILSSRA
jgi:hypothetical protein